MDSSCCAEPGASQSHASEGHVEQVAGVDTYKTGDGQSAIVIFTDIFGFSFVNARKIADRFAQETGMTVLVPDLFHGDPIDPSMANYRDRLPDWRERHPPADACALAENFISTIKEHYQPIQVRFRPCSFLASLPSALQVIGFCYGAKPVVHLITHREVSSTIRAAIVGHPTFLVKEDAAAIKRPILFLCAETDERFTPDVRAHFEAELTGTGLGTFIEYPGTTHGFIVRPDGSPQACEQSETAIQDAIGFFEMNLLIVSPDGSDLFYPK